MSKIELKHEHRILNSKQQKRYLKSKEIYLIKHSTA